MLSIRNSLIFFNIHPLFPITLLLMAGIFFQSLEWSFYLAFSIFCLSCIVSYIYKNNMFSILAGSFLLGSALYQKNINRYFEFQNLVTGKKTNLLMTITDIAQSNHRFLKYRITGFINTQGSHNLLWYCPQNPNVRIGDTIKFEHCTISLPKQNSIKQYFLKQQIAGTINSNYYQIVKRPGISFTRWLFEYRSHIINSLKKKLSKNTFNFMALIFFGNKEIDKKSLDWLKENFKFWGISHYLARSGLHLVIFIFLWETLLKILPLTYFFKQSILCILTLVYVIFSWSSLSFVRSLAAFFLYKYGLFFKKQIHPIHAITVITFCSLLINPFYLFFLDFQLSFGITFLLTWANHIQIQQTSLFPKNS